MFYKRGLGISDGDVRNFFFQMLINLCNPLAVKAVIMFEAEIEKIKQTRSKRGKAVPRLDQHNLTEREEQSLDANWHSCYHFIGSAGWKTMNETLLLRKDGKAILSNNRPAFSQ